MIIITLINKMMNKRIYRDKTSFTWWDPAYIQQVGPITKDNALDYFSYSFPTFYEKDSNNELLRTQGLSMDRLKYKFVFFLFVIRELTGVEFVLTKADEQQNLFFIEKRIRLSPNETHTISLYYIQNGVVF